jgi:hypothetical protein
LSDCFPIQIALKRDALSPLLFNFALEYDFRKVEENQVGLKWGDRRMEKTAKNEELRDFCSSQSIIRIIKVRRIRWAGHVARMGEKRNAYRLLVRKPEGKRRLARPRRRCLVNIGKDLVEVGWCDVVWLRKGAGAELL